MYFLTLLEPHRTGRLIPADRAPSVKCALYGRPDRFPCGTTAPLCGATPCCENAAAATALIALQKNARRDCFIPGLRVLGSGGESSQRGTVRYEHTVYTTGKSARANLS